MDNCHLSPVTEIQSNFNNWNPPAVTEIYSNFNNWNLQLLPWTMSLPSLTSDWNLIWFQRLKSSVTVINYANAIPQTWLKFNPMLTTATPLTDWNLVETTEILNKRHKLCYKGRTIKATSISNTKFWRSVVSIVINFFM